MRTEGYGWLIPSLQPVPWDDFVRDVWRVTDEADRRWMVERLAPTPFKTFTDPVRRTNPAPNPGAARRFVVKLAPPAPQKTAPSWRSVQ